MPRRRNARLALVTTLVSIVQSYHYCRLPSSLQSKPSLAPVVSPNALRIRPHKSNLMSQKLRLRSAPVHQEDDVVRVAKTSPNSTVNLPLIDRNITLTDSSSISASSWGNIQLEAPPLSIFLLNLVAVIWGSQHAVIKLIVEDSSAGPFTLLRFGVAALIASPYTPGLSGFWKDAKNVNSDDSGNSSDNGADKTLQNTWRWGAEMGLWMFLGFSFQAIGLATTTAQRSGFLLYLVRLTYHRTSLWQHLSFLYVNCCTTWFVRFWPFHEFPIFSIQCNCS